MLQAQQEIASVLGVAENPEDVADSDKVTRGILYYKAQSKPLQD